MHPASLLLAQLLGSCHSKSAKGTHCPAGRANNSLRSLSLPCGRLSSRRCESAPGRRGFRRARSFRPGALGLVGWGRGRPRAREASAVGRERAFPPHRGAGSHPPARRLEAAAAALTHLAGAGNRRRDGAPRACASSFHGRARWGLGVVFSLTELENGSGEGRSGARGCPGQECGPVESTQVQSLLRSGMMCVSCARASEKAESAALGARVGFLRSLPLTDQSHLLPPGGRTASPDVPGKRESPPTWARATCWSRRSALPAARSPRVRAPCLGPGSGNDAGLTVG